VGFGWLKDDNMTWPTASWLVTSSKTFNSPQTQQIPTPNTGPGCRQADFNASEVEMDHNLARSK